MKNKKKCNCKNDGGLGIVRPMGSSRVGRGLTMDPASSAGRRRSMCDGGLGIVRPMGSSRDGQGLTMDPQFRLKVHPTRRGGRLDSLRLIALREKTIHWIVFSCAVSAGRRGSMCDDGRSACRRRDSESGRVRFRNYEDGTTGGGFLSGTGSDNGSRIKCGMTERVCGTTKRGDSESGRSMVEMLGTLAIMGVLAIGGVAGYRWAMDKYRANDTIKELTQRALVYGQQMNAGSTTLSSAEFNPADTTKHGYGVTAAVVDGHPLYFKMDLTDVPEAVCDAIVDSGWTLPVGLSVNGTSDALEKGVCAESSNVIAFTFHKDLSVDESGVSTTASETTTTTATETTSTSSEEAGNGQYCCPQGTDCTTICGEGQSCYRGVCESPTDYGCSSDKPLPAHLDDSISGCFSCDAPAAETRDIYTCRSVCDGRNNTSHKKRYVVFHTNFSGHESGKCVLTCPEGTTVDEDRQLCVRTFTEEDCSSDVYFGGGSDSEDKCNFCGGRFVSHYGYAANGICCGLPNKNYPNSLCSDCGGVWIGGYDDGYCSFDTDESTDSTTTTTAGSTTTTTTTPEVTTTR